MTKAFRGNDKDFHKTLTEFAAELGVPFELLYDDRHIFAGTPYPASYRELEKDKIFRAATHVVRANSEAATKFMSTVITGINDAVKKQYTWEQVFKGQYMIIQSDPKKVDLFKVFMNITLDNLTTESISNVSWIQEQDTLATLYSGYRADMADTRKSQAWATPSRALHRLCRTEEMPLARVLARYTNLTKLGHSDTQIRDIATSIEEAFKPMELKYTEKPEDFLHMYQTGPSSCMALKEGKERTWKFMVDKGFHPSVMFHYSPYVKGVWTEKNKKVVARCFAYQNEDGSWKHGRAYADTPKLLEQFTNTMTVNGITALRPGYAQDPMRQTYWERSYVFEVPAIEHGTDFVLPYPYFDNHSRKTHVTYDTNRKVFIIDVNGKKANNVDFQNAEGYVSYRNFVAAKCDCCGRNLTPGSTYFANTGSAFCSSACYTKTGYTFAHRGDGTQVLMKKEDAVVDFITGQAFTNDDAAERHGCFQYVESLEEAPEEDNTQRTSDGMPMVIDDKVWIIPVKEYERISAITKLKATKVRPHGAGYILPADFFNKAIEIRVKESRAVMLEDHFSPLNDPSLAKMMAELRE